MNNNLSIALLISSIIFYVFYLVLSIRSFDKMIDETLLNTFPYETNKKYKVMSLLILLIGSIVGILYIVFLYPLEYRFGFQITSIISCVIALISFFLLNIINFVREKVHYLIFSIFFVTNLALSISLGGSAFNFYNLLDENIFAAIISIFYFLLAIAEVLFVVPNLSVTLKMNSEMVEGETILKKPHFIKLSLSEWIFSMAIFAKMIPIIVIILLI